MWSLNIQKNAVDIYKISAGEAVPRVPSSLLFRSSQTSQIRGEERGTARQAQGTEEEAGVGFLKRCQGIRKLLYGVIPQLAKSNYL